jgi:dienelactone hydrolase
VGRYAPGVSAIESVPFAYEAGGEEYRGAFVARGGVEPSAACVLLPDWRGQSALAHDHARFLVEHGCVVVIGDLYGDGFSPTDPSQVGEMVKRLMENRERGVDALAACVTALRPRVPAGVPIFCLGYSAGGMVALDYGRTGVDLGGIIVASALLKTAASGTSTRIKAPVLILQGTQDQVSPLDVIASIVAEMDAAGNDFRLELYGQSHHAFDNPEVGTNPTKRLVYSPAAAARSRRAIADFIRERTPTTPTHRARARATISVKRSEATAYDPNARPALVEINLVETFAGEMSGESTVRAFQVRRDDGSATMVSLQRFSGKLGGRAGTFVLQGSETVDQGKIHATWFVVPRSGTGELTRLRGEGGFEGDFGQGSDGALDYWFE